MPRLALIILDGFGINDFVPSENAIRLASTPTFDALFQSPHARLDASGKAVGVPDGQMGNSEIGHLTIGSGRIIRQSLVKISDLLDDDSFADIPAFRETIRYCEENGSVLHLFTLFGPGGVHAHDEHLQKILPLIPLNIPVRIHLFTDGGDLAPTSALGLMREFLEFIKPLPNTTIASIGGRYYGMDRDNNWERVQKSYSVLTDAQYVTRLSPVEYLQSQYDAGNTDEFIEPVLFSDDPTFHVRDGDGIIHLNFRADRAIQMTKAFIEPDKTQLKTKNLTNIRYVAMTNYYPDMPCETLIEDDSLENTLGEILANHGRTQLRLAETEKFAHVTKFFDGGKNVELPGKKEILVPSHKVATYDLDPEMSASEIWDVFQREAPSYDMTIVNFANGDMVGHTGSIDAARRAVEKLDVIIAQMIEFCANQGIELLITADHGNCEEMGTPEAPKTQHSLNPVPCWHIYDGEIEPITETGGLADIAPTCLTILELPIPAEMTGKSLTK